MRLDPRDPKGRPADFADYFKPGKYDVYILGDVDSTAFHGDELARSGRQRQPRGGPDDARRVSDFGPGGYNDTVLAKVLPVGMDRLERQQPDEPVRTDLQWPGPLPMRPTPLGLMHFALMLAGQRRENEVPWAKLPPLEGGQQVPRSAPGAVVLADAGSDKPLLVAQTSATAG